jgi:hypothetical protein
MRSLDSDLASGILDLISFIRVILSPYDQGIAVRELKVQGAIRLHVKSFDPLRDQPRQLGIPYWKRILLWFFAGNEMLKSALNRNNYIVAKMHIN